MATSLKKWGVVVTDATDPVRIRIKLCDIKDSVCMDHQQCVIANAVTRSMKALFVDVGTQTVIVQTVRGKAKRYVLDSIGKEIVHFFDTNDGKAAPSV